MSIDIQISPKVAFIFCSKLCLNSKTWRGLIFILEGNRWMSIIVDLCLDWVLMVERFKNCGIKLQNWKTSSVFVSKMSLYISLSIQVRRAFRSVFKFVWVFFFCFMLKVVHFSLSKNFWSCLIALDMIFTFFFLSKSQCLFEKFIKSQKLFIVLRLLLYSNFESYLWNFNSQLSNNNFDKQEAWWWNSNLRRWMSLSMQHKSLFSKSLQCKASEFYDKLLTS